MTRLGPLLALLLLAACSDPACEEPKDCHDLVLHGQPYDVYTLVADVKPPGQLEEVGNATFPACNCAAADLDGDESTDVWRFEDLDSDDAVLGLLPDGEQYALYLRVGVDPTTLPLPPRDDP